ncbi:hypothetical protein C8R44DRAFT_738145 [Mycena epipterygia]|nr:hypothetical protein C8R44DRAFT_738145 [Mycena epipterygia]
MRPPTVQEVDDELDMHSSPPPLNSSHILEEIATHPHPVQSPFGTSGHQEHGPSRSLVNTSVDSHAPSATVQEVNEEAINPHAVESALGSHASQKRRTIGSSVGNDPPTPRSSESPEPFVPTGTAFVQFAISDSGAGTSRHRDAAPVSGAPPTSANVFFDSLAPPAHDADGDGAFTSAGSTLCNHSLSIQSNVQLKILQLRSSSSNPRDGITFLSGDLLNKSYEYVGFKRTETDVQSVDMVSAGLLAEICGHLNEARAVQTLGTENIFSDINYTGYKAQVKSLDRVNLDLNGWHSFGNDNPGPSFGFHNPLDVVRE